VKLKDQQLIINNGYHYDSLKKIMGMTAILRLQLAALARAAAMTI